MNNKRVQEELEHDVLLENFSKAQNFYEQNKAAIIGVAIALIVIIAGSIGYYYYSESQENKAQELMGQATQSYLNGDYKNALEGSDADFTVGFEQIINNYSRTDAANLARYYSSVCEYNLGNTEKALDYIEGYEIPDGILGVGPLSFYGVLLSDSGNYAQAAEMYLEAASQDKNDSTTPYNYLEAAKAFHDAGNKSDAKKYAQKIIDSYPNSSQIADAEKLLGTLAVTSE